MLIYLLYIHVFINALTYIHHTVQKFNGTLHSNEMKINKIYREKRIPMTALWCPAYSVIMANFIMPETHQPIIVIILIIYSVYL